MVVRRMKGLQVQDGPHAPIIKTNGASIDTVLIGVRPPVEAGNNLHAVRAQDIYLTHIVPCLHRFQIGVAGHLQMAVAGLHQTNAALLRVGHLQECEQGVLAHFHISIIEEPGNGGRRLRDHTDRAKSNRVLFVTLPRQRVIIPRCPYGLAGRTERNQRCGAAGFPFGRAGTGAQALPKASRWDHARILSGSVW